MLETYILFRRKKFILLPFAYLVKCFSYVLLFNNVFLFLHQKSENSRYIFLLSSLLSSIHSFIHLCVSLSLSLSLSLSHPLTHSQSFSLLFKRAQQHKIVHYSLTLVAVFLFHFSLCMPCKEKMLLYALTPSTILRKKILTKRGLKL